MKTKLTMQMPEAMQARDVEITGAVVLPDNEYQTVLASGQLPAQYIDRLNKYTEAVTLPRSSMISEYKALLVLGEDGENGVAVCGKNHVSYASVFPGAKEWLGRRVQKAIDFAVDFRGNVSGKRWEIPYKMFGEYCDLPIAADNGIGELLLKELRELDEITNTIMHQDCFEINYALDYGQKIIDTHGEWVNLMGLIGCNLHDVHLLHNSEEHDLATIVDLTPDTLTEQGKRNWADVLNAKVENISHGYYGTQIDLSGCTAERIRDFSYMLAGQCSVSDYDKWVNDEDYDAPDERESQGMTMQ